MDQILTVDSLNTRFHSRKGYIYAVNGISFQLNTKETLGIVGESGSGKSVSMLSLIRLLPPAAEVISGKALFKGRDLLQLNPHQLRGIRGSEIGMIFQDPMTSLNPVINLFVQLSEPLIFHLDMSKKQAWERCLELLQLVGIPDGEARLKEYPHQLSGGMRQRVMIAMALACNPAIVIADEPTTALDVTIQAQIIAQVNQLKQKIGTSIIWITHNLGVVAGIADRVLVMYAGTIVEEADVFELFSDPRHPYTLGLLESLPNVDETKHRLSTIPGSPPVLGAPLNCCPFYNRCKFSIPQCQKEKPSLEPVYQTKDDRHRLACWVDIREKRMERRI
jgi:oligopeptide transport system ATP-binding protein